jgi:hypothetical protein
VEAFHAAAGSGAMGRCPVVCQIHNDAEVRCAARLG